MSDELRPLTSLRFIAAAMIVFFHLYESLAWSWLKMLSTSLQTGVSFFFVLSGFILTHVYRGKSVSYSRFIWLRIARLWPAHVAMLIFVAFMFTPGADTIRGSGWFDAHWTALANLFMLQSWVPYAAYYFSWDGPTWSISAEMFFYLLFPLLLIRIDRTWHWKLAAALGLSVVIALVDAQATLPNNVVAPFDLMKAYFVAQFPPMRLTEFCLGMAANVLWARHVQPMKMSAATWTALECAALFLVVLWLSWLPGLAWQIPIWPIAFWAFVTGGAPAFAILIIVMASGRGYLGNLLSTRIAVYLGSISFAVYMVHSPLIRLWLNRLWWPQGVDSMPVTITFLFAVALIVGSCALHELIEKPFRALLTGLWFRAPLTRGPLNARMRPNSP